MVFWIKLIPALFCAVWLNSLLAVLELDTFGVGFGLSLLLCRRISVKLVRNACVCSKFKLS